MNILQVDAVITEGCEQKPSRVVTGAAVLFEPVGAVARPSSDDLCRLACEATHKGKLGVMKKTVGKAVCTRQERASNCDSASRDEEEEDGEDVGNNSPEPSVRKKMFDWMTFSKRVVFRLCTMSHVHAVRKR